jgi:hypothetical protein
MCDQGFPKFKISHHTGQWQALKVKKGEKNFGSGGDCKGTWVWHRS